LEADVEIECLGELCRNIDIHDSVTIVDPVDSLERVTMLTDVHIHLNFGGFTEDTFVDRIEHGLTDQFWVSALQGGTSSLLVRNALAPVSGAIQVSC
jgi:hypothetical protein